MSVTYYDLYVADSTVASGSPGKTGLTPTFTSLKSTGASPGADVSGHAAVLEIGKGHYQVAYDPEQFGEAAGEVDCGAALSANTDRFLPVFFARDSSRIANSLTAAGGANLNLAQAGYAPRALDAVADAALTTGDLLLAGGSGATGRSSVVGTGYTVETPAGTVIRSFTLNSPSVPTARS